MSSSVVFPLRDDYFKPLEFTPAEEKEWKELVATKTQKTLDEERSILASNYENVDPTEWKLFKTKDQVRVYRPRSGAGVGDENEPPSVLAVGTIEGTLEDVIYGIHNTTTRDIRVTRAFLSDTALDSAVLHVFENGTNEDPFHSLAVKWRAVVTPAGSLVKNRDGCVIEYMGIKRDASGKRYAVQVSENFDHPICPPFNQSDVIRADVHVRAIYREVGPQRVGVYFRAGYNMSGRIPKILASWTAASLAIAVSKSVECAEAKKLTALALDNHTVYHRQFQHLPRPQANVLPCCTICKATPRAFSGGAMGECQICAIRVCHKCSTKKFLLSDGQKIRVSCCKQCIVAAKKLKVDPRQPLRLLSATSWYNHNLVVESVDNSVSAQRFSKVSSASSARSTASTRPTKISFDLSAELSTTSPRSVEAFDSQWSRPSLDSMSSVESIDVKHLQRMNSGPQGQLMMQMEQLRLAAELTYQMTTQQGSLMRRRPESVLVDRY